MIQVVQFLAAIFYFANKVFFACAEYNYDEKGTRRKWRIRAWKVYLIGLTPWLIIFFVEKNWIAFWVELGGGVPLDVTGPDNCFA